MDFTTPRYFQSHVVNGEPPLERANKPSFYVKTQKNDTNTNNNPFAETFPDPLCKLNLKETSEFVKSFPMPENSRVFPRREGVNSVTVTQRRLAADLAPPTPGRSVFGFSSASPGNFPRKSFPSKWDDAEKWLISTSCHDSPAHSHLIKSPEHSLRVSRQSDNNVNNIISGINANNNNNNGFKQQIEVFSDKSRVTEEKVSKAVPNIHNSSSSCSASSVRGFNGSTDVLLKDKFTDDIEPTKEACLLKNSACEAMRDAGTEMGRRSVEHRDVGTEMTPLGSSTTSRCHTPFKSSSPARHNTPANRSGPLGLGHSDRTNSATIDIAQLQECHLAKLQLGTHYDSVTSNWSSREEEEEEISKSLRHFETDNGCYKNFSNNAARNNDSRAVVWEEEEKTKCCSRYQREEAKIQAWVNLQSAKAEAQSRKLEVKIQKMRSNLEEKLMKRMAEVHRKAEEWRASARQQHSEQMKKATENAHKMSNNRTRSHFSTHTTASCGCFPCNHNHYRS